MALQIVIFHSFAFRELGGDVHGTWQLFESVMIWSVFLFAVLFDNIILCCINLMLVMSHNPDDEVYIIIMMSVFRAAITYVFSPHGEAIIQCRHLYSKWFFTGYFHYFITTRHAIWKTCQTKLRKALTASCCRALKNEKHVTQHPKWGKKHTRIFTRATCRSQRNLASTNSELQTQT